MIDLVVILEEGDVLSLLLALEVLGRSICAAGGGRGSSIGVRTGEVSRLVIIPLPFRSL